MTSTGQSSHATTRARRAWGLMLVATVLALGTLAVIWFAAVPFGPLVCPAIDPAPRNCYASDRAGTGLVTSALVGAVYLATILTAAIGKNRLRMWVVTGVILLGCAPLVSYLAVAWIPGFPL